jgi:L-alanine-DL-glutamate epimerase-like enolase superfamily enzyme
MKYAFIMNSGNLSPEVYSKLYEDRKNHYYFAATHGMEMTRELARKLADEGYDFIDLCGDFDAEKTEDVRKASGGKIQVNYAKYSEEELAKYNALLANDRYGIIVLGFDAREELVRLELESTEYNTYVAIVDTEETAAREAKKMVEEGIHFIELCGYFNAERAEKIMKAIDYKAPVGYCGK